MRFILAPIVILAAACGGAPSRNHITEYAPDKNLSSSSYSNVAVHSGAGWAAEVGFYLHQDAPERIVNAAINAADKWNVSAGKPLLRYLGRTQEGRRASLYSSLNDSVTVIYYEASWTATTGKNELILATTVWENSANNPAQLEKGDIILNAETYILQDSTLDSLEFGREDDVVDAETVLVHEMGHLLGLNHWDMDDESVMNTYTAIGLGETKRHLGRIDGENIKAIYTH